MSGERSSLEVINSAIVQMNSLLEGALLRPGKNRSHISGFPCFHPSIISQRIERSTARQSELPKFLAMSGYSSLHTAEASPLAYIGMATHS